MNRFFFTLLVLFFSACQAKPESAAEPAQPVVGSAKTRLAHVLAASSLGWLEAPARALATPNATAVVSVPLPARVLGIRVKPGDQVQKGAPLVDVTMPELIGAAGALSAASLRLTAYEKRRERIAPLSQEGLVRSADVMELEAQIATSKADRESARATLRAAGLGDEQAAQLLSGNGSLALRSPIDGVVVAILTKLGETREPSAGALVEIASAAPTLIEARFHVPPAENAELIWVEPGRSVQLAKVAMSPAATREDGTRVVWLRAKLDAQSPVAGALGRVRVVPPAAWSVIPSRALLRRAEGTFVAVPDGSGRRQTPVAVVRETPNECVVTGLKVGEDVFLSEETDEPAQEAAP